MHVQLKSAHLIAGDLGPWRLSPPPNSRFSRSRRCNLPRAVRSRSSRSSPLEAPPLPTPSNPLRAVRIKVIPNVCWFLRHPPIAFRVVGERRSRQGAPRPVVPHKSCPERTRLRRAAPVSPGTRESPAPLLRLWASYSA
jgi:hypothetical protein